MLPYNRNAGFVHRTFFVAFESKDLEAGCCARKASPDFASAARAPSFTGARGGI